MFSSRLEFGSGFVTGKLALEFLSVNEKPSSDSPGLGYWLVFAMLESVKLQPIEIKHTEFRPGVRIKVQANTPLPKKKEKKKLTCQSQTLAGF